MARAGQERFVSMFPPAGPERARSAYSGVAATVGVRGRGIAAISLSCAANGVARLILISPFRLMPRHYPLPFMP